MRFMVIEHFRDAEAVREVYRRFREKGRQMPEGLRYVDSWIDTSFHRCFLLAECDDPRLLQEWVLRWNDLVEFEVVPVVASPEAAAIVAAADDPQD